MLHIQVLVTTEYVWGSSSEIMLTWYMILLCLDSWSSNYSPATVPYLPPSPSPNGTSVLTIKTIKTSVLTILIRTGEDKEKKKIWKNHKVNGFESGIECLLCSQMLCKILGIRRWDMAFALGIWVCRETGTCDYSKCGVWGTQVS